MEHLNAEVVLGTVTDLPAAVDWIRSTFLFVRANRHPRQYGLTVDPGNAVKINAKLQGGGKGRLAVDPRPPATLPSFSPARVLVRTRCFSRGGASGSPSSGAIGSFLAPPAPVLPLGLARRTHSSASSVLYSVLPNTSSRLASFRRGGVGGAHRAWFQLPV